MSEQSTKPVQNALILFADIIDSSVYSSILGIEQYAEDLLNFHRRFEMLAEKHFNKTVLNDFFIQAPTRGDEGTVFCIAPQVPPEELIFRAIQFAFELKAILELIMQPDTALDKAPRKMTVGIGIHYGEVVTILKNGKIGGASSISDIAAIEGFSINYTKRIESGSRAGKFSKIFLSKSASAYLWDRPVVLQKHQIDLKNIAKYEDVYEVRSAFFKKMPLDYEPDIIEKFIIKYALEPLKIDFIQEPWLKSFVISVLEAIKSNSRYVTQKKYMQKQLDLAWANHAEDDPILLFVRAIDCKNTGKQTRRLSILKEIVDRFPSFVFARKELVKAISDLMNEPSLPYELIYARDMAQEFLGKFKKGLKDSEIKEFETITAKIEERLRSS